MTAKKVIRVLKRKRFCTWIIADEFFETGCGEAVSIVDFNYESETIENLVDSGMKYCNFCGKFIK